MKEDTRNTKPNGLRQRRSPRSSFHVPGQGGPFAKKKDRPVLDGAESERLSTHHARMAKEFIKRKKIASACYHADIANYIFNKRKEPDGTERRGLFLKAKARASAPFSKGKGKGYDVYPPNDGGPEILKGVVIVRSPENYSIRFPSMQDALDYVRVNNVHDAPVRVHKKS